MRTGNVPTWPALLRGRQFQGLWCRPGSRGLGGIYDWGGAEMAGRSRPKADRGQGSLRDAVRRRRDRSGVELHRGQPDEGTLLQRRAQLRGRRPGAGTHGPHGRQQEDHGRVHRGRRFEGRRLTRRQTHGGQRRRHGHNQHLRLARERDRGHLQWCCAASSGVYSSRVSSHPMACDLGRSRCLAASPPSAVTETLAAPERQVFGP